MDADDKIRSCFGNNRNASLQIRALDGTGGFVSQSNIRGSGHGYLIGMVFQKCLQPQRQGQINILFQTVIYTDFAGIIAAVTGIQYDMDIGIFAVVSRSGQCSKLSGKKKGGFKQTNDHE